MDQVSTTAEGAPGAGCKPRQQQAPRRDKSPTGGEPLRPASPGPATSPQGRPAPGGRRVPVPQGQETAHLPRAHRPAAPLLLIPCTPPNTCLSFSSSKDREQRAKGATDAADRARGGGFPPGNATPSPFPTPPRAERSDGKRAAV